jgi:alpha-mannosidase
VQNAIALNTPLIGIPVSTSEGGTELSRSIIEVTPGNVIVGAFKKAEEDDALVIRLYEAYGCRGRVKIRFGFDVKKVVETNLLEDELNPVKLESNEIEVFFKPYEIKTIKVSV